jgi:Cu+-exporting ATPase
MVTDPVCGFQLDPATAFATREHAGQTLYFSSQACVDKFDEDPHYYGHPDMHPYQPPADCRA